MVLAATTSVFAQTAQPPPAAPATPAPKAPASAGVINDWLRQQSAAWSPWDLGVQIRTRYEGFDNASAASGTAPSGVPFSRLDFQKGVVNDNGYLWLRQKAHLGYTSAWFGAYVEGRNSSSISDNDSANPGQDRFDLHQAYLTLGNPQKFPLSLKVGRQEMIYGDERLIGAADWANIGRVFDNAKLRYENQDIWVDAFSGRVVVADDNKFNDSDHRDWFSGAYASSKTLIPVQETQLYFLSRNVSAGGATAARDIYSVGARVKSLPGQLNGWDYASEVVGQFGSILQAGARRDQEALAASVGGGYTWTKAFATPRLGVEYNYSSGDSSSTDGKNQTLDNLFPTNHKPYGLMDLVGWRNIHNPHLSLSAKPDKKVNIALDYHLFWLADTHDFFYPQSGAGRNGNGYSRANSTYDSFAGSEVDLDVTYAITPWAGLRTGYGHFFTGGYVDASKQSFGGSKDADWIYVQLTLTF